LPSLIFIGMCFGSPLLSYIAEKTNSYLLTIVSAGIIMASGFISFLIGPMDAMLVSLYFVLIGICSAYQILAIYKASTFVKEEVAGLTTASANMIIMIFGYLFHSLIGWLVGLNGGAESPSALKIGISVIPITLLIGSCGFIALWRLEKKAFAVK
ncbi:MAG: MFS transporter, partial [Parachlamydiaceae bacterium]